MTRIYLIYLSCYVVFLISSSCCCGDLVCYMGSTRPGGLAVELENKTCDHVYNNTQIVSRYNKTEFMHVQYSLHGRDAGEADISHCLIFLYDAGNADFTCDHDAKCALFNQSSGIYRNVEYKGNMGSLYCCQHDLCNDVGALSNLTTPLSSLAPSTPQPTTTTQITVGSASSPTSSSRTVPTSSEGSRAPTTTKATNTPSLMCYHGTNKTVEKQQCQVAHCVTEVTMTMDRAIKVTQYSCDHSHRCHLHMLDDSDCYNDKNVQRLSTRTCCCSSPLCNAVTNIRSLPPFPTGKPLLPTAVPGRSIHPGKLPGLPPSHPQHSKSTVSLIGGVAGAVFLGLLLIVIVGIVVRRCRHPPSETTYSYTQLTADLAEDEATEDEYMLMG